MTSTPEHPGTFLTRELAERDVSQVYLARRTGLSGKHINQVCRGKAAITPFMAVRVEAVLGTSARTLMHAQADYELADAAAQLAANPLPHPSLATLQAEVAAELIEALGEARAGALAEKVIQQAGRPGRRPPIPGGRPDVAHGADGWK